MPNISDVDGIDTNSLLELQKLTGAASAEETVNGAVRSALRETIIAELVSTMSKRSVVEMESLREAAWRRGSERA